MGKKVPSKPESNTEQNQQAHLLLHQQQQPPPQPQQHQQQQQQHLQQQQLHHLHLGPFQQAQPLSSFQQSFSNENQLFHYQTQHQEAVALPFGADSQFIMSATDQQQHQQQKQLQQQQQQYHQQHQQEQLLQHVEPLKQQQLQLQEQMQPLPFYNQSACSTPTSGQASVHQPDYQPMVRPQGINGGGSVSLSPAKMDYSLLRRDETAIFSNQAAFPNEEPSCRKRHRLDPPVVVYQERSRLEGHQFRVSIPGTGPKLLVNRDEDGEGQRINTEISHLMTLELSHTADPSFARFRFLLVYSKDAEVSTAVVSCGIHRREEHPKHMLEVKVGDREANIEWQDDPHPSVLVTPTAQAPGRFTCQLAFLCRNSCLTRKELTLLCQLEVGESVVAREPFKVKVSACPRRDAGAPTRPRTWNNPTRNCAGLPAPSSSLPCTFPLPQIPASDQERMSAMSDVMREAMEDAEKQGKRTAWLVFQEKYFRDKYPEQHREVYDIFCQITNCTDV